MKNLPDKIYLNFGEITKEEFEADDYNEFCKLDEFAVTFCEDKVYDTDVEFVRKDAFIGKACEFLKDRVEHDSIDYPMATKHLVEDFKKYMKGEQL